MTIDEAVAEVFDRGHLAATERGQRTVTIAGVRLAPIRWQAAICGRLWSNALTSGLPLHARHLEPKIDAAIRQARAKAREQSASASDPPSSAD